MAFAELHVHTDLSNLRLIDSINTVKGVIKRAQSMGLNGVAITDHESLSSHMKAKLIEEEIHKTNPNFKVILGNEIYLVPEESYKKIDKFFHFILLAKDAIGHKQLRELSSRAWERSYRHKGQERVPTFYTDIEEIIGTNKGHVIASTACLGSFLSQCILNTHYDLIDPFLEWCIKTIGRDYFFIEIQPANSIEQIKVNRISILIAKNMGIPCIITNDAHFLTKEDSKIHASFLNSKDEEREVMSFYADTYFKTEKEMEEILDYIPKDEIAGMFSNTCKIIDMCETYSLKQDTIVPKRSIPKFELKNIFEKYYKKFEFINKFAHSEYEQDRFLLYQIEKGFIEKGQEHNQENITRIDIELKQLWLISEKLNQRLSCYYNITQEIIDIMWDDDKGNSLVGVARGSVTGYYICYLMSITQINPITWGLPHWRHLEAGRPELPDIDFDSEKARRPYILQALKDHYGEKRVLNIITFRTEGTKSAILTACRGLDIDNDTAQEIADMVPVTRGKSWTINECLNGDEETEKSPLPIFSKKIQEIPHLLETALGLEGLICGRGIHASGIYLFNNDYIEQSSFMRAPNGTPVTCWSMEDNDLAGALKEDALTIEGLDKIRKCLEFLLKDKKIEWQGSLRATYNKYLHPDVLDYTSSSMWARVAKAEIMDLFQFETSVGGDCVQKVKPTSLKELALSNSLMRLSAYQGEMPMDKYIRFKTNIDLWYEEMKSFKLTKEEQEIVKKYVGQSCGIAAEQEDIMLLSMEPKISNFTIGEANLLRKAVAKKKKKVLDAVKELFFKKGLEAKTTINMLNYVWLNYIMPQAGYGFSKNHSVPYSAIALQQMNLVERFSPVYWNASCLTVNASADEDSMSSGTTNYGKIATAISKMMKRNVLIELPDINTADFGFKPNVEKGNITFGLKGINGVGDDVVRSIIEKRPYESLENFLEKQEYSISPIAMINLIKAGCFDNIEKINKQEIMKKFVKINTILKNPPVKTLSMAHFPKIIEYGMYVEKNWPLIKKQYNFYKYVTQKIFERGQEGENLKLYWLDPKALIFFKTYIEPTMKLGKDYFIKDGEYHVVVSKMKKWYENAIEPFKSNFLRNDASKIRYNQENFNKLANEFWDKYCSGTNEKWEMDSLSFYYTKHELADVSTIKYGIVDFFQLPSEPTINYTRTSKKGEYTQYCVYKIIGTVLDKDRIKRTVTLLTPSGVVLVKFYGDMFINYNKQISRINLDGTKNVIDKSWFSRGTKLQILGFRRDDQFIPRAYKDVVYKTIVAKITGVTKSGLMETTIERPTGVEEEEDE
jgi:DNA polymerase III subunit alpha